MANQKNKLVDLTDSQRDPGILRGEDFDERGQLIRPEASEDEEQRQSAPCRGWS
jgi:hypothetical protein